MDPRHRSRTLQAAAIGFLFGSACIQALSRPVDLNQFEKTVRLIRSGQTIDARTNAAEHLATLVKKGRNGGFSETEVTQIISLLDSSDDSVRYWIAIAIGHIGPSGKRAIPKLLAMLPEAEKTNGTITSADGIRFALIKMGVKPPPPGKGVRIAG